MSTCAFSTVISFYCAGIRFRAALAQYYRMFPPTELRKFGRLYQVSTTIGRPQVAPDGEHRVLDHRDQGWRLADPHQFMTFFALGRPDPARSGPRRSGARFSGRCGSTGASSSAAPSRAFLARAHWRFATFISYPHFLLFNEAIWSAAIAFVFGKALEALGVPGVFSLAAAAVTFVAVLGTLLKYTENRSYLLYLLSDTIWTWEFSHRQRPEWDARIDRFAQYLVDVAGRSDAEEIVIVGHSFRIVSWGPRFLAAPRAQA